MRSSRIDSRPSRARKHRPLRRALAAARAVVESLEDRRLLSVSLTTLATFTGANGASPLSGLTHDAAGNLYGTTFGSNGDNTIYEIAAGTNKLTTLATFAGADPAISPLLADSAGDLFGTTTYGGNFSADQLGSGTIFEIAAGSSKITTLATFNGADGDTPTGALTRDATGDLYGVTSAGGASYDGAAYELPAGAKTVKLLASFTAAAGTAPTAGPLLDSAGDLFGTTSYGGAYDDGTDYEVAAGAKTVAVLASFNGA